jgi:hypothetical protein
MTTNETPGPSGTVPDRYLEDISVDELSANAPADETDANRDARRERNRKWNERRRRLRESLPIRNLAEALDQVESRVHTTPEQCLMSITTIACQAQGMRTGEVIAKLAEDAYFMRVDNRVTQVPPSGTFSKTMKPPVAVLTSVATVLEGSYRPTPTVLGQQPVDPLMVATAPAAIGRSSLTVILAAEAVTAGAPTMGLVGGDRGGRGHSNSHASGASRGGFDTRQKIEELWRKKSSTTGDNDGFPAFSTWLCNLVLPKKFKPLGITKYDAKQDPVQWLRCYALSIENAGGNNDTKCLYFPFCLDQAPLTWLESLEKYSIDKWDQLKE